MMRPNLFWVLPIVVGGAIAMASCSGTGMPSSPSALSAPSATGSDGGFRIRPMDDPPPGAPAPVDPAAPAPAAPVPVGIVGTSGILAFQPNPVMAAMGSTVVWTNSDLLKHRIIIDDPTPTDGIDDAIDLGDMDPGASSAPFTLTREAAQFHCLYHPSMKGGINQPPPEDVAAPAPDPYMPPDNNYYYGYRHRGTK